MNVVSQITSYQRKIEKSTDDESRILHCIEKLYKLPVTVQHLQETGVGKTVNALRKYDGTVGDAAKALVAKWKSMVADEESSDDDDDNTTQDHQERYSDKDSDSGVDKDADSKKSSRSYHASEPREKENRNSSRHESSRHTNRQSSSDHSKSRDNKKENNSSDHSRSSKSSELKSSRKDREHKESSREKKTSSSSSLSKSTSKDDKHREKTSKRNYDSKDIVNGNDDKKKKYRNDITKSSSEKRKQQSITSDNSDDDDDDDGGGGGGGGGGGSGDGDDGDDDDNNSNCDLQKKKLKTELYDSQISKYRTNNETISKDSFKKDRSHKEKDKHRHTSDKHKSSSSSTSTSSSSSTKTDQINNKKYNDKEPSSSSSKLHNNDEKIKDKKSHHNKDKYKNNKDDDKKDKKKSKKKYNGDGGIDCNSGASFAEALGMCTKTSKKKIMSPTINTTLNIKTIKSEPGTSTASTQLESTTCSSPLSSLSSSTTTTTTHGRIKIKTDLLSRDEPLLLLSPNVKLPPLVSSVDLAATLPETNPNYKPLPPNYMNIMNKEEESKALGKVIYAKNARTKVYSGNKTGYTSVPSLYDICIRVLIENIDALEVTGGVPYDILKPVLERATVDQLYMLEQYNPYLLEDTDILWKFHCNKEFRNKERKEEELESWRNMYMRCLDERDEKLKRLTENINKSKEKSLPVRSTKLAYVDNIVKPPRNVLRKQARYGTSSSDSASDIKKKLLLGGANSATNIAVSAPSLSRIKTSSGSIVKKNKAPLMMKALQLIKSRYKR